MIFSTLKNENKEKPCRKLTPHVSEMPLGRSGLHITKGFALISCLSNVLQPQNRDSTSLFLSFLFAADLLPYKNTDVTLEFLQKVVDVLKEFVMQTNDRNVKILDFRHPEDMKKILDLEIPEQGLNLQTLINDCVSTLKYQVKTGTLRLK